MSENEMNIAIAKRCGWTHTKTINNPNETAYGRHPVHTADVTWELPLPNYCGDRNAVASIVNDLTDSQWDTYCRSILYIHSRDNVKRLLSSKQHAEALLHALGE